MSELHAAFASVLARRSLDEPAAGSAFGEILDGGAAARDAHARALEVGDGVIDVVGAGGDGASSFNVSTAAAIVAAVAGARVAKHGRCPVCRQKLHPEMPWHIHHVIWKVAGGSDRLDNLVPLHPNCHRQVHSRENPSPFRVLQRAFEGFELDEAKVSRPVLRGREAP